MQLTEKNRSKAEVQHEKYMQCWGSGDRQEALAALGGFAACCLYSWCSLSLCGMKA